MSNQSREVLLSMFDERSATFEEDRGYTTLSRRFMEGKAVVIKTFKPQIEDSQQREREILSMMSRSHQGEKLSNRASDIYRFKNATVTPMELITEWHGFDCEDWVKLTQFNQLGQQVTVFNEAQFIAGLTLSTLKGLRLLNGEGIVHCDIKPDNLCLKYRLLKAHGNNAYSFVLVPDDSKIIDVGIAKCRGNERPLFLKDANKNDVNPLGLNPQNRSPALIAAYKAAFTGNFALYQALDWRVDLWHLGACLEGWVEQADRSKHRLIGGGPIEKHLREFARVLKDFSKPDFGGYAALLDAQTGMPHTKLIANFSRVVVEHEFKVTIGEIPKSKLRMWSIGLIPALLVGGGIHLAHKSNEPAPIPAEVVTPVTIPKATPLATPTPLPVQQALVAPTAMVAEPIKSVSNTSLDSFMKKLDMKLIGTGSFKMGSTQYANEQPVHRVQVTQKFFLSAKEITVGQWQQYMDERASFPRAERDKDCKPSFQQTSQHPVVCVNFQDVNGFLIWLNQKSEIDLNSKGAWRLPTEAEWEYAARAGTETNFYWGDDIAPDHAQYNWKYDLAGKAGSATGPSGTAVTGSFSPNKWGLFDMHGNVWEWVQDCYEGSYNNHGVNWTADQAIKGANNCRRVLRGGAWNNIPNYLRSADRLNLDPTSRYFIVGFRVARTAVGL
jgi:formylglycine-generating enzyme required for sulfatase activity